MRSCAVTIATILLSVAPLCAEDKQVEVSVIVLTGPSAMLNSMPAFEQLPGSAEPPAGAKPAPETATRIGSLSTEKASILIRTCREKHKAKIVAEPRLVTLSGRPANFVAGGQIAIPGRSADSKALSITYRDIGTELDFLPVVHANGDVYMELGLALRSVNEARGIQTASGFVPGFDESRFRTAAEVQPDHALVFALPDAKGTMLIIAAPKVLPPSAEVRTAAVAKKLAENYHAACARGDAVAAREFAQLALDLDPLCLARTESKDQPRVGSATPPTSGVELLPMPTPVSIPGSVTSGPSYGPAVELVPARHMEPPARKP